MSTQVFDKIDCVPHFFLFIPLLHFFVLKIPPTQRTETNSPLAPQERQGHNLSQTNPSTLLPLSERPGQHPHQHPLEMDHRHSGLPLFNYLAHLRLRLDANFFFQWGPG